MKRWHAVHCKPLQDARAVLHMRSQSCKIFRPLIRRCRMRLRQVLKSMFPGYLFVRLDDAFQNRTPIRSICGVAGGRSQ